MTEAETDLETIVATALRLAKQELLTASEFTPFAIVIDDDGRLLAVDLDTSALGKHPELDEVAEATRVHLTRLASTVRCTALTLNTRLVNERSDAIEIRTEHRDGIALLTLLTYKRPKFGGSTEYGQPRTYPGTREVWA